MRKIIDILPLLGRSEHSEDIKNLLDELGVKQPLQRPETRADTTVDVKIKKLPVDLRFKTQGNDDREGKVKKKDRELFFDGVFIYPSRLSEIQKTEQLPFGFLITDQRPALLEKQTPVKTWLVGKGRVPVTYPSPSHDTWQSDEFNILASYSDGLVDHFQIFPFSVIDEAGEWKAPPTWQDFALLGNKLEAIKNYQKETKTSMIEAKKAIDDFLSEAKL